MNLLQIMLLFALGSIAGYILEVIRRSYCRKKLINPGFLKGPYLPVYGFGLLVIYGLSSLKIHLIVRIILFGLSTTILELITGLMFIYHYKKNLWDYSKNKFNYKGIICLRNSIYWVLLSLVFYFFIYPFLHHVLSFANNPFVIILIILFYTSIMIEFICRIIEQEIK